MIRFQCSPRLSALLAVGAMLGAPRALAAAAQPAMSLALACGLAAASPASTAAAPDGIEVDRALHRTRLRIQGERP